MYLSVRKYTTAGIAAVTTGVVTFSLVTAPPNVDAAVSRAEVRAVQLAAITTADIRTAALNTAAKVASLSASAPIRVAAASTQSPNAHAAASIQQARSAPLVTSSVSTSTGTDPYTLEEVLYPIAQIAVGILRIPVYIVWYAAFPITIPLTIWAVDNSGIPIEAPGLKFIYYASAFTQGPFAVASLISPPASTALPASTTTQAHATIADTITHSTQALASTVRDAKTTISKAITALTTLPTKKTSTAAAAARLGKASTAAAAARISIGKTLHEAAALGRTKVDAAVLATRSTPQRIEHALNAVRLRHHVAPDTTP